MNENTGGEADESPTLGKLAAALAKAQGAMHNAEKTANNPGFNRKYATLAAVWDACREPLAANGLAVVQRVGGGDGRVILTTDLIHAESGEFMRSRWVVPADVEARRNAVQALGSATTYARRYALAALVGVAVEDDDGEGAGAKAGRREREDQRDLPPENGSRPSSSGGGAVFPNFGPAKGAPVHGATAEHLQTYLEAARKSLADPSKAKWHAKESALIGVLEAELARQRGSAQPTPETKSSSPTPLDQIANMAKAKGIPGARVASWLSGNGFPDRATAKAKLGPDMVAAFGAFADAWRPDPPPSDEDHETRAENVDDAPF